MTDHDGVEQVITMAWRTQAINGDVLAKKKLDEIVAEGYPDGKSHSTPGPRSQASDALHRHYGYELALAFNYSSSGDTLHVLALGKKNDKAKQGNSGYDWSDKGKV